MLKCAVCGGPMVGDAGFYTCINKKKHLKKCTNNKMSSANLDRNVLSFVKSTLLDRTHFEKVIASTKKAYQEEIKKTSKDAKRLQKQIVEIDAKIERNMILFERGTIKAEIIEQRIIKLEAEKQEIEETLQNDQNIITAVEIAESELNDKAIKSYIDKFEELLDDSNEDLMRNFLQTFIHKIELHGRENGKRKSRRLVNIHGFIPTLTGITFASPRGVEPLLQDRKS
ncbi:MAG: hypothetical protein GF353_25215 [Candidatus Lokiarchaeota archaeon]|nr:hypothetical protein [Candidatus Lokiarchaeota archaeon]